MHKNRLEAFSDGVIAILITIMVLEFTVPHEPSFAALCTLAPKFLAYALSFVFLGIYWNNHHHMFQAAHRVNGAILWANLHLLFWLSLVPFTTAWMGESHWKSFPVAAYGFVLFASGAAYFLLSFLLVRHHGPDSALARAVGTPIKETISVLAYSAAVGSAFVAPWISGLLYALVAAMWLVPDRRIEKVLSIDS
jgi:uncharacterized membrane protein